MDKVKELMAAGLSVGDAIKQALGMPLAHFALKYSLPSGTVSNHINAIVRPTPDTLKALASELGGSPEEFHTLLWQAMRPAHLAAS